MEDSPQRKGMLLALNRTGKPIYEGTASPSKVAKRRAKNRQAHENRKKNRGKK